MDFETSGGGSAIYYGLYSICKYVITVVKSNGLRWHVDLFRPTCSHWQEDGNQLVSSYNLHHVAIEQVSAASCQSMLRTLRERALTCRRKSAMHCLLSSELQAVGRCASVRAQREALQGAQSARLSSPGAFISCLFSRAVGSWAMRADSDASRRAPRLVDGTAHAQSLRVGVSFQHEQPLPLVSRARCVSRNQHQQCLSLLHGTE